MITSDILDQLPSAPCYWLGYSGGLDSHVLLYVLAHHLLPHKQDCLKSIHINHGLSNHADQWQQHCEKICAELNVPLSVIKLKLDRKNGDSLEAHARKARYAAFAQIINPGDCLITAHHRDDQIETFLYRLFRGAGVKGLSAISSKTDFSNGILWRPLLNINKDLLRQFAVQNNLKWVEDESNQKCDFDRNYLRHQLIPQIQKRWPGIDKTLTRSIRHFAQTDQLLTDLAAMDYKKCCGSHLNSLSIRALSTFSEARKKNVLRYWIIQAGYPIPSDIKVQEIIKVILTARQDANPLVSWGEVEVRRYRDMICLLKRIKKQTTPMIFPLQLDQHLQLPFNIGSLIIKKCQQNGVVIPKNTCLDVRFRQGGERCTIKGQTGSRSLKKLFQQWGVPPWQRDKTPLIYCDGVLACVVGYKICEPFYRKSGDLAADELSWEIMINGERKLEYQ